MSQKVNSQSIKELISALMDAVGERALFVLADEGDGVRCAFQGKGLDLLSMLCKTIREDEQQRSLILGALLSASVMSEEVADDLLNMLRKIPEAKVVWETEQKAN